MTLYLLSVHMVEGEEAPGNDEMQKRFKAVDAFNTKIQASGQWVFGGGLHPVDTATVVDGTGPEVLVTDGPFAEAKEHIGGFWVLRADDLDAAMKLAAEASGACGGPVEVRPFQDDTEPSTDQQEPSTDQQEPSTDQQEPSTDQQEPPTDQQGA